MAHAGGEDPIYDQTNTQATRHSLIPVRVNGTACYLVVVFDKATKQGRIAEYSEGYVENGLPARRLSKLNAGDEIVPEYDLMYYDEGGEMHEARFDGEVITLAEGALAFGYESLEDSKTTYWYCFCLNGIFGGYQMSDVVEFAM